MVAEGRNYKTHVTALRTGQQNDNKARLILTKINIDTALYRQPADQKQSSQRDDHDPDYSNIQEIASGTDNFHYLPEPFQL